MPDRGSDAPLPPELQDVLATATHVAADASGSVVAAAGADGLLRVATRDAAEGSDDGVESGWEGPRLLDTDKRSWSLGMRSGSISSLYVDEEGRWLLYGDHTKKAHLWDLRETRPVHTFDHATSSAGSTVSFASLSRDGTHALTVTLASAWLWDCRSGELLHRFAQRKARKVDTDLIGEYTSGDVSPDATRVATAINKGGIALWDAGTGEKIEAYETEGATLSVRFSPDGKGLLVAGGVGGARVVDVETGEVVMCYGGYERVEPYDFLWSVGFACEGRFVLGRSPRAVALWDADTGDLLEQRVVDNKDAAVLGPSGRLAIARGGGED